MFRVAHFLLLLVLLVVFCNEEVTGSDASVPASYTYHENNQDDKGTTFMFSALGSKRPTSSFRKTPKPKPIQIIQKANPVRSIRRSDVQPMTTPFGNFQNILKKIVATATGMESKNGQESFMFLDRAIMNTMGKLVLNMGLQLLEKVTLTPPGQGQAGNTVQNDRLRFDLPGFLAPIINAQKQLPKKLMRNNNQNSERYNNGFPAASNKADDYGVDDDEIMRLKLKLSILERQAANLTIVNDGLHSTIAHLQQQMSKHSEEKSRHYDILAFCYRRLNKCHNGNDNKADEVSRSIQGSSNSTSHAFQPMPYK